MVLNAHLNQAIAIYLVYALSRWPDSAAEKIVIFFFAAAKRYCTLEILAWLAVLSVCPVCCMRTCVYGNLVR